MRKRRKFYRGVVNHVYQKSTNGVNMFYEWEDFIVFYSIFSVCAKSADVKVLELCIMYNHFHCLIRTESVHDLSSFMDRFTAWFVMEHNTHVGRKGKLLKKNYGSAPKWDDKAVRNAINYVGNNPIEKKLCKRAEEYRWNFLAYAFPALSIVMYYAIWGADAGFGAFSSGKAGWDSVKNSLFSGADNFQE